MTDHKPEQPFSPSEDLPPLLSSAESIVVTDEETKKAEIAKANDKAADADKAKRTKKTPVAVDRTIEFYSLKRMDKDNKKDPDFKVLDFIQVLIDEGFTRGRIDLSEYEYCYGYYAGAGETADGDKYHKFAMVKTKQGSRGGQVEYETGDYSGYDIEHDYAHRSHFVVFEDGFVAFEFNTSGPRLNTFAQILDAHLKRAGVLKFFPVGNKDALKQLGKGTNVDKAVLITEPADLAAFNKRSPGYQILKKDGFDDSGIAKIRVQVDSTRGNHLNDWVKQVMDAYFVKGEKPKKEQVEKLESENKFLGKNDTALARHTMKFFRKPITKIGNFEYGKPISHVQVDPEKAFTVLVNAYISTYDDQLADSITMMDQVEYEPWS